MHADNVTGGGTGLLELQDSVGEQQIHNNGKVVTVLEDLSSPERRCDVASVLVPKEAEQQLLGGVVASGAVHGEAKQPCDGGDAASVPRKEVEQLLVGDDAVYEGVVAPKKTSAPEQRKTSPVEAKVTCVCTFRVKAGACGALACHLHDSLSMSCSSFFLRDFLRGEHAKLLA